MKILIWRYVLILLMLFCFSNESISQKKKRSRKKKVDAETTQEDALLLNEINYYNVIKPNCITDEGLFLVHNVDGKYYFEIPDTLFGRDMLQVSRIVQLPQGIGGGYVNAGTKTHEQLVRWEKKYDKVLIRTVSYVNISDDSLAISLSVKANNYEPILFAFDIAAYSPDSSNVVIEVSEFYTKDIEAISGIEPSLRTEYKITKLDSERSFIEGISSYPKNVEVRQEMTYIASEPPGDNTTGAITMVMNQSMILLPGKPMMPRIYDPRVGWFTLRQIDYGSKALKADSRQLIRRWRLEPSNPEAYARGRLVEPVNPIVYYLDPATPPVWRKYFKEGIELWQDVFEAAGFKNAIFAKDPPTKEEDPEFSPEDIRYSVIRYVASTTRNAMGPSVVDPRSGEIIESDIMWYHNHFRSYRNRYLLETGAANPGAQTLNTSEEEMGEMIKMVIAHEVGHALGLPHNMKASSAYPVDSLRSGSFTQRWGIAATIMDYARFNYVAQPGDKGVRFIRQMGPYDYYSINWGYRWLPDISSPEEEKTILNDLIRDKEGDPVYMFGSGNGGYDPSAQTENVGDNPVKASTYGLKNLKIVAENLVSWTAIEGEGYDELEELYGELITVWKRYIGHVVNNIGGIYQTIKTSDQGGDIFTQLPREIQKESMLFINRHAFTTPRWLLREEIVKKIESYGVNKRIYELQTGQLNNLLDRERIERMLEGESLSDKKAYTYLEMMDDLRKGLWVELDQARPSSMYRRNLQKAWIERMDYLIHSEDKNSFQNDSDIGSVAYFELNVLKATIDRNAYRIKDKMTRVHLDDCIRRIIQIQEMDK